MPLSSVVGAQSIVKPGVCTSSTRPASPYDGQVIYETDTDKTLVWNGTGWVFLSTSRANPVGLDLIKTQTIGSAVSSVVVSDVFSSTYDNYKIIVSGGVASTTNALHMTVGSTTSGYGRLQALYAYNASTVTVDNDNFASPFVVVAGGSVNGLSGSIEVLQPFTASATSFYASYQNLVAGTANSLRTTFGALLNTTSYTAFTLTTNTGTITGGTISVYGYAK